MNIQRNSGEIFYLALAEQPGVGRARSTFSSLFIVIFTKLLSRYVVRKGGIPVKYDT